MSRMLKQRQRLTRESLLRVEFRTLGLLRNWFDFVAGTRPSYEELANPLLVPPYNPNCPLLDRYNKEKRRRVTE